MLLVRSRPWSNLVNLGQTSPNLEKCAPGHVLGVLKCDQTFLGSNRFSLGYLVLHADAQENLGGKNRVMTQNTLIEKKKKNSSPTSQAHHF
jgi:hypothetical protein